MKILFVTPYFVPAWSYGGPVKVVNDLAQTLHGQGHDVTVVTTDVFDRAHRHNQHQAEMEGIHVLYFRNLSNTLAFRFNAYLPLGFSAWCKKHLGEFDAIHCHDLFTWQNIVISRLAPKVGRPYFIQPHGALNATRVSSRMKFIKRSFLKIFPGVLQNAKSIFVSTAVEKDQEITRIDIRLIKKTYVVPNGLSLTQLSTSTADQEVRTRYGIQAGELFLLYFGRIQYIKGIDITLRGLALLADVPWKFLVVGRDDGALVDVQRIISEQNLAGRVQIVTSLFGEQMKEIIRSADIFLFTSRSEGLPMAALDACAAQLPSILSKECNVPEISQQGAGILLPENTPEAVAAAVKALAEDAGRLALMRQQCHQVIRTTFNLDSITKQLLRLYTQN